MIDSLLARRSLGHGRRLATATAAALCISLVVLGGMAALLLHLEADYESLGAKPGQLAALAFRLLHTGRWLGIALLAAVAVFVLVQLLARRHGVWLALLAPLAYLAVLVPLAAAIWLPLQSMSSVVAK